MKEWLTANLYNLIVTLLGSGGIIAYFTERKRRKIQEKKDASSAKMEEANALETIQTVYNKFVSDSLTRYNDLIAQIEAIKSELSNVSSELETVTLELQEEKRKNSDLKTSYDSLEKACIDFKKMMKSKKPKPRIDKN